jgi:glycosyltransferase involved in cell wall biosynthesis
MQEYADVAVCCALPKYPAIVRQLVPARSTATFPTPEDLARAPMPAMAASYFALPGATRPWNGDLLCRSFLNLLEDRKPDVLLAYWIYPEGYAVVKAAAKLGVPAIVGARGSDLKLVPPASTVEKKTRYTVANAAAVLCVSADLARAARGFGSEEQRTHTLLNGVNRSIFHLEDATAARARLGVQFPGKILLYVGNLLPVKGVGKLMEAAAALVGGDSEWRMVVIGEGTLAEELRNSATSLGISAKVDFLGARGAAEIAAWMNAADLLCVPSESEGCPNVILEALACGRPVVATAVGGIPELLDADSGMLLPNNAPGTILAGLHEAAQKKWDREAISRKHARGWDDVARDTLRICEAALGE